jgi:hypothetical protein
VLRIRVQLSRRARCQACRDEARAHGETGGSGHDDASADYASGVLRTLKRFRATLRGRAARDFLFTGLMPADDGERGGVNRSVVALAFKAEEIDDLDPDMAGAVDWVMERARTPERSLPNPGSLGAASDLRLRPVRDVLGGIGSRTNLAMLGWEDFEHLACAAIALEYGLADAATRVTRARRDGGVDAVLFDPDPIRGGRIVIQSKRTTATVGPSAVRELHSVVMNEGAIKGILVTTSGFGRDSYEFARRKPITLVDGAHLLAILSRHGKRASIDLHEARRLWRAGTLRDDRHA